MGPEVIEDMKYIKLKCSGCHKESLNIDLLTEREVNDAHANRKNHRNGACL